MRSLLPYLLLCGCLHANDALDVLEGRKNASDIPLPPVEVGETAKVGLGSVVYNEPRWEPSPLDSAWSSVLLYEDSSNPVIQQAAITGFFNLQAAFGDADVVAGAQPAKTVDLDGSRSRRARLGSRLRVFRNTDIEAAAEFAGDDTYERVERLSAETRITPGIAMKFGKFRPSFTREYATDDQDLPYPNRSMLVNMIAPASTLGVMVSREVDDWGVGLGWFSSDRQPDFPGVEGDGFVVLNFFRTMVEPAGTTNRRTRWHLDYIHNLDAGMSGAASRFDLVGRLSANGDQAVTRNPSFRHLMATGVTIDQDNFSLSTDVLFAKGDQTVWGISVSPSYWLVPGTLKLVARYQLAQSEENGALVSSLGTAGDIALDASPFFVGNQYQSIYVGTNFHLYQDEVVLMSGFEKVRLKDDGAGYDTDAAIWYTGARVSF